MNKFLMFFILLALVAGCSGGSGSGESPNPTPEAVTLEGKVIDPAVKDARVELRKADGTISADCGVAQNQLCAAWTDQDGAFIMYFYKDVDFTGYYFITYGGTDVEYGTDFVGVSMKSPLDAFPDHHNIIISPATSLLHYFIAQGDTIEGAKAKLQTILGLPSGTDPLSSPLDNSELVKASYMASKIALLVNDNLGGSGADSDDAFDIIAAAVYKHNPELLTSDPVLDELFGTDADAESDKQVIKDTADMISEFSGDPDVVVADIKNAEKIYAYKIALADIIYHMPVLPEMPAAEFDECVAALAAKVDEITGGVPVNTFIIEQIVNTIVHEATFFGDYDNYLSVSDFNAELAQLEADELAESLTYSANNAVYNIALPIKESLGMDNAKRIEYYFKSNIDINYKARMMINKVYDDDIIDNITLAVVNSYASFGLHRKAADHLEAYIIGSLNRASAYGELGARVAKYSYDDALVYFQKSRDILDAIYNSGNISTELMQEYLTLMNNYEANMDTVRASEIGDWIKSKVLPDLTDTSIPSRYTVLSGLMDAQRTRLANLIASDAPNSVIIAAADYLVELADSKIPAKKTDGELSYEPYAAYYGLYVDAIKAYRHTADGYNTPVNKDKAGRAFLNFKDLAGKAFEDSDWNFVFMYPEFYGSIAGDVYWALGETEAKAVYEEIPYTSSFTYISTQQGKYSALRDIMIEMAFDKGFDDAVTYYKTENPLTMATREIRGMLGGSYGWSAAFNTFATVARERGDDAMAAKAMEYIVKVYDDNHDTADLDKLVCASTTTLSTRYSPTGYVTSAETYYEMGDTAKALAILDKAEAYTDSKAESYHKSKAYAVLAYYHEKFGNSAKVTDLFNKAAAVVMPDTAQDYDYINFYAGLAYDAGHMQVPDKKAKIEQYMALAVEDTALMYDGSSEAESVRTSNRQTTYYKLIMETYYGINDYENIMKYLVLHNEAMERSGDGNIYRLAYQIVDALAGYGLVDEAYEVLLKYADVIANGKNYNINVIAESVLRRDDFKDSDIAFLDTDKDGKPDFFVPWATPEQIAASGLELDDDIDGDGKLDNDDLTPFFAD